MAGVPGGRMGGKKGKKRLGKMGFPEPEAPLKMGIPPLRGEEGMGRVMGASCPVRAGGDKTKMDRFIRKKGRRGAY